MRTDMFFGRKVDEPTLVNTCGSMRCMSALERIRTQIMSHACAYSDSPRNRRRTCGSSTCLSLLERMEDQATNGSLPGRRRPSIFHKSVGTNCVGLDPRLRLHFKIGIQEDKAKEIIQSSDSHKSETTHDQVATTSTPQPSNHKQLLPKTASFKKKNKKNKKK